MISSVKELQTLINNKMTENEKQLKETEVVLMRLYQKGEITIEAFTILNDRNKQAINYTHCCTELKTEQECYKTGKTCMYKCKGLCKNAC